MNALILVDLQNDFFPNGTLAVPMANEIKPKIEQLLLTYHAHFQLIVATKDWHPQNHVSFALNHNKQVGEVISVNGSKQILWPIHCVQETYGAELMPSLDRQFIHKVFCKGSNTTIDSYSAFFDNQHVKSTGLKEYLNKKGIHNVYIAGLATDYCVKYSVLDAIKCGFNTFVIVDACKGVNLNVNDTLDAFNEMILAGAIMINTEDIDLA